MNATLLVEALSGLARGWSYMPVSGKIPVLMQWTTRERATAEQIEGWVRAGYNLGVRTGPESDLFVVDVEKDGELPPGANVVGCPVVATGGGGKHYYFQAAGDLGNSARRLGPKIDTRGKGGYVLAVGSIHPDTGREYVWERREEKCPPLCSLMLATLTTGARIAPPAEFTGSYADVALRRELAVLSAAPNGARNETLNRAAFNMGTLVGAGALSEDKVEAALSAAALGTGLDEKEVHATLRSGLRAGKEHPRAMPGPPPRVNGAYQSTPQSTPQTMPAKLGGNAPRDILVPGAHIDDQGEYVEMSNSRFAWLTINALPRDAVWRRAGIPGCLRGERGRREFDALKRESIRMVAEDHMRFVKWIKVKDEDVHKQVFVTVTADYGALLLSKSESHEALLNLDVITRYPIRVGPKFELATPGYSVIAGIGVHYDEPESLTNLELVLDVQHIHEILEDLVCDFPFQAPSDRVNYFGLLLTPLLRPALSGNVPLHLVCSPLPRSGKSKLCAEVLGGTIIGEPTPSLQLTGNEDERDKRVLSILMSGQTLIHLDNLGAYLDSAVLSSLLTSQNYQGRMLGVSKMVTAPNKATLVASGNNIRATTEIAKRVVPIALTPMMERPELRKDFKHTDIGMYAVGMRRQVLGALHGAIELWLAAGSPRGKTVLGGFEHWASCISGILETIGYTEHMQSAKEWVDEIDDYAADLARLVTAWWEKWCHTEVTPSQLLELARDIEVFPEIFAYATEHGRVIAFGRKVVTMAVNRVIGTFQVKTNRSGNARKLWLERMM